MNHVNAFEIGQSDYYKGLNEPSIKLTGVLYKCWLAGWKDAQGASEYDYS